MLQAINGFGKLSCMMLKIKNITKYYGLNLVLNNLNLIADKGDVIRISGPSGSGKTTLLRCIAGLEKFESGIVEIEGKTVQTDKIFIPPHKRKIGMVFQDFALWPHMTVWQNLDFVSSSIMKNINERKNLNEELLYRFRIDHEKNKYPSELSGGEQQRVALARAMANRPQIILLDEPFTNLDTDLAKEIINEILDYTIANNILLILVSHSVVNFEKFDNKSYKLIDKKLCTDD